MRSQESGKRTNIEWSSNPGFHERQLQRKCENPLFPASERRVVAADVERARQQDRKDAEEVYRKCVVIHGHIGNYKKVPTHDDLMAIRKAIEELLHEAVEVGGEMVEQTLSDLLELYDSILGVIEKLSSKPEGVEAYRKANAAARSRIEIFINHPFIAQLKRLSSEEVVPALLTEDIETIRKVMEILPDDNALVAREAALDLLDEVQSRGDIIPCLKEKRQVLHHQC